jgi:hypothetical protein
MKNKTIMKLPEPIIATVHNVTVVGPYSAGGATNTHTAAKLGYLHGAEVMAAMFREAFATGNIAEVHNLIKATETNSFFSITP